MLDPAKLEAARRVAEAAAARAAIPEAIRQARDSQPTFEGRAVKQVCDLIGRPDVAKDAAAMVGRMSDERAPKFWAFHRLLPEFPVALTAGRLRFHYDGIAAQLLNEPWKTPMYSAWVDAHDRREQDGYLGLVFTWPRVKKCRGWCILHDVPRNDPGPGEKVLRADAGFGFRIVLPTGRHTLSLEPLPAFLNAIGWLQGRPGDDDE